MSSKVDLQHQLNEIGYKLGPFTSKDTLSNIIRLHSFVLTDRNINVADLNDAELRKNLTQYGLFVGPVTNHTRSIYQRKLLEVFTNDETEGDEDEIDESTLNIDDENILYPSLSDVNSFSYGLRDTYDENTIYPSLSNVNSFSYGLRDTYDEPIIIRNDYKANRSSTTRNTYRDQNLYDNSNEIRPRITTKSNEPSSPKINKDSTPKKVKDDVKLPVTTKSGGTRFYGGITIIVAFIVFALYVWFEK